MYCLKAFLVNKSNNAYCHKYKANVYSKCLWERWQWSGRKKVLIIARSSHQRCSLRKGVLRNLPIIHRKTPVPESLFKFKNLFIEHGEKKRQVKDSRYSEAAIVNYISILNFCQNLWKILVKDFVLAMLQAIWLQQFSSIFQAFINNYFEGNLFHQNTFSGCFCLCQKFRKNKRNKYDTL